MTAGELSVHPPTANCSKEQVEDPVQVGRGHGLQKCPLPGLQEGGGGGQAYVSPPSGLQGESVAHK